MARSHRGRRPRRHRRVRRGRIQRGTQRIAWVVVLVALLVSVGVIVVAYRYGQPKPVATVVERVQQQRESGRKTRVALPAHQTRGVELERQAEATREVEQRAALVPEIEQATHSRINAERGDGVLALQWDGDLAALARAHSDDMTSRNYFNHDTPEGLDPTDRLHKAGLSCRKGYRYGIAENLVVVTSAVDTADGAAAAAVKSWLGSPGHRANLMNWGYDRTGIGASFGRYGGHQAVYLTQVFC